jgi:hypothetical protein
MIPMRSAFLRRVRSLLCLAPVLLAAGCGGSTAPVSGTVTLNGVPLTGGGTVTFQGKTRGASAIVNPDGTYSIPNAPLGEVQVAVLPARAAAASTEPPPDPAHLQPPQTLAPTMAMPMFSNVPPKYADPNTSGLTCTVESGEQTIDLPLTP